MGDSFVRAQRSVWRQLVQVIAALVLSLAALVLLPCVAMASSYGVGPVDIDAGIASDGSLEVVEQRTYTIEGSVNGIYWEVPRGTYEGRELSTEVLSVGVMDGGSFQAFSPGSDGAPGTYESIEEQDCVRLKVYWPMDDEAVAFQVSYRIPRLVSRWADAAELYWQYVPADEESGVEWKDITATVHLPVPGGEPINPGENVRAWAHGPLDGEISFSDGDVIFRSPGVGAAEFLEARVAFSPSWLSQVEPSEERRLERILAEEEQWAADANAQRRKARLIACGYPGVMVLGAIGSILAAVLGKRRRTSRVPKAKFADTYYRDVPSNDHPAVLGMLYRHGALDAKDFSATLMRLADQGRLDLDVVWADKKDKRGRVKRGRDWRMLLHKNASTPSRDGAGAAGKKIDDGAFSFLYDVIADRREHMFDPNLLGPNGEPYVLASFFGEVADRWPNVYRTGYNKWADAVQAAYRSRHFVTEKSDSLFPGLLGLIDLVLAVGLGIAGMFMGVPSLYLGGAIVVLFGAGVYVLLSDEDEPISTFSQEAAEIQAKLEALKRWLADFTRLEEAIPTDVVLWNRLLVMATVLGVADKVVKQLKVHAPQLIADPAFCSYRWYDRDLEDDLEEPIRVIGRSVESGKSSVDKQLYHETSSSSTASSHDSSSRGSGGGFSRGGGGGFSGGGRGGTF